MQARGAHNPVTLRDQHLPFSPEPTNSAPTRHQQARVLGAQEAALQPRGASPKDAGVHGPGRAPPQVRPELHALPQRLGRASTGVVVRSKRHVPDRCLHTIHAEHNCVRCNIHWKQIRKGAAARGPGGEGVVASL